MKLRCLSWACVLVVGAGCHEVTDPNTAPLTLTLLESGLPLVGVELCETGTANCETTDALGRVTIKLPFDRESSYTLEKEGYARYLLPIVLSENGLERTHNMLTDQQMKEEHDRLMSDYPSESTGNINLNFVPRLAGGTFDLIDAIGKAYYKDEEDRWIPEPDLTSTTSTGQGGFVEVSPGEAEAVYGGTAQGCVVDLNRGWPGNFDNSIRFPVRAGYRTGAAFNCPSP